MRYHFKSSNSDRTRFQVLLFWSSPWSNCADLKSSPVLIVGFEILHELQRTKSLFIKHSSPFIVINEAKWIPDSDICLLPGRVGSCRAGFPRYYYNAEQEKCLIFTYGGCGGNRNNFRNEAECKRACGKWSKEKYKKIMYMQEKLINSIFADLQILILWDLIETPEWMT